MLHLFVLCCLCWRRLNGVFGDDKVKFLSVTEGDSVALNTDVTEIHEEDDILWKYGAGTTLIAQIYRDSGIFSTYDDVLDGRFRDRLKLDYQTGSLTITNTTNEHAGDYKLQINGVKLSSKAFDVSVYTRLSVPVIIRNSSQCSSSDQNCSVLCSVVNVSHVTLSWYKGNSLLSSISVSDLSNSLSLPLEVEYQDTNTYSCVVSNPISNQTQHLNFSGLCNACEDGSPESPSVPPDSPFLTVVISAGFLLIVLAVVIFCICRKKREKGRQDVTYAEPIFQKRARKSRINEEEDGVVYSSIAMSR